jgi:hypothetical protein
VFWYSSLGKLRSVLVLFIISGVSGCGFMVVDRNALINKNEIVECTSDSVAKPYEGNLIGPEDLELDTGSGLIYGSWYQRHSKLDDKPVGGLFYWDDSSKNKTQLRCQALHFTCKM